MIEQKKWHYVERKFPAGLSQPQPATPGWFLAKQSLFSAQACISAALTFCSFCVFPLASSCCPSRQSENLSRGQVEVNRKDVGGGRRGGRFVMGKTTGATEVLVSPSLLSRTRRRPRPTDRPADMCANLANLCDVASVEEEETMFNFTMSVPLLDSANFSL